MVNLREKPFYLNDEQIKWVEETYASMTTLEKKKTLKTLWKVSNRAVFVGRGEMPRQTGCKI